MIEDSILISLFTLVCCLAPFILICLLILAWSIASAVTAVWLYVMDRLHPLVRL